MKSQKIPKPVLTKGEGDGTLIAGTFSTFFKGASRKMGKKEATTERGGTLRVFGQNRIDPPSLFFLLLLFLSVLPRKCSWS